MPSRINMGPDGGPYIAINENSGNIELEDNTGTTVAIWDDANSQWDFQNNPISNVDSLTSNSVNTDEIATSRTWQDVTPSRNLGDQYINQTNGEIQALILLDIRTDNTSIGFEIEVDGIAVDRWDANGSVTFDTGDSFSTQAINIPAGSTYSTVAFRDTSSYELDKWIEFRP